MNDFLEAKVSPWEFRTKYLDQRDRDLEKNKKSGYTDYYLNKIFLGNEKEFEEKYINSLYEEGSVALKKYEKGAKILDIKGEMFFMGMWDFIDIYILEFYPSNNEGFDPLCDVDEQTLIKRVQMAFDVLERNKKRWEQNENESIKI